MVFKKIAELIMVEQTLFALPFAYIGVFFAGGGRPLQWVWVTLALVAARTAGMSFNRVLDAEIDAKNPRTANRIIQRGEISKKAVWALGAASVALLVFSSYMLNELCFYLSFAAAILLFTYSLFKRFSSGSHFYLGLVEAAAPIGGYLAVAGRFDVIAFLPGIAIMFWIAGMDILYSLQDLEFDRAEGLFSVPARFGVPFAFNASLLSYCVSLASLSAAGQLAGLSWGYWASTVIVAVIFAVQQMIARGGDIRQGMLRVFRLNRFVSPALLAGLLVDYYFK